MLVAIAGIIACSVFVWLYFYTADLPDVMVLRAFAPRSASDVEYSGCVTRRVSVIPYSEINGKLRGAMMAVNGNVRPGILKKTYLDWFSPSAARGGIYSIQLARGVFCSPQRQLARELAELRTAIQIERRFTADEIVTIYANRVYEGADIYGVEGAAMYYFHKHAKALDAPEAGLIIGLIRSPNYLSPIEHPDRALRRRNEVVDGMLRCGAVTIEEAERAKKSPLNLAVSKADDRHAQ